MVLVPAYPYRRLACLWPDSLLLGQSPVWFDCILMDSTVELLVLWKTPVMQVDSLTPTGGLATTGFLGAEAFPQTFTSVVALLNKFEASLGVSSCLLAVLSFSLKAMMGGGATFPRSLGAPPLRTSPRGS